MQMPEKSTVLLVKCNPTVAFYTWHCTQMLLSKYDPTLYHFHILGSLDQSASLACNCASILSSNPAIVTDVTSLLPSALLPQAALPVSESAGYLQDPAKIGSLGPELRMCMSFLTGLLQPGCPEGSLQHPSQASATRSVPVPTSAVATACTPLSKPVPELHSIGQCDSPAASQTSSDQQHMTAITRLKRALGGVVMTSKLISLAQHVKSQTSEKQRHRLLLALTRKLLEDVSTAARKLAPDTNVPAEDLQNMRHLIRALMLNALDTVRQAAGQALLSDGQWSLLNISEQAVQCCLYSSPLLFEAALGTFSKTGTILKLALTTVSILL